MKKTTMRKVVCLLMVAMLALSLSIAVFARVDGCEECGLGGTYRWVSDADEDYDIKCSITGSTHDRTTYYDAYTCSNCGNVSRTRITGYWYSCGYSKRH